jgi:hypothetical protein
MFDPEERFAPDTGAPEAVADVVDCIPDIDPPESGLPVVGVDPADPPDPAEADGPPSDPTSWPGLFVASGWDVPGPFAPAVVDDWPPDGELEPVPFPVAAELPAG